MLLIQKLKQPKVTSGVKISPNKTVNVKNVQIKNKNKFDIYLTDSVRKAPKKKKDEAVNE